MDEDMRVAGEAEHMRPLTAQVASSIVAVGVLAIALLLAVGLYAVTKVDDAAHSRQSVFVARGVSDRIEALQREQRSVTLWDDSVERVKSGDQDWMTENLGAWMYTYYGHDRVYVLDAHNEPIHAMRDGATLQASAYGTDRSVIEPLAARLRAELGYGALAGADPSKAQVEDILTLDGRAAIVGIQPIVPNSSRVAQLPGSEFLHVSVQFFDDALVAGIAKQFQLEAARFSPAPVTGLSDIPVASESGAITGYIVWKPYRPGLVMVASTAPAMAVALLLIGGMVAWLVRRLRRAASALNESRRQTEFLAFHDTLTGLPNRALFEDRLDRALATIRRHGSRMALVLLDLDRFKQINDTLGHPAGDELVRQVARRLSESVREIDTVARIGGDEFAVVLVDIRNARTAELVCERFLEDLAEPFVIDGQNVFASASVGIAIAPESGAIGGDLMRKADVALYEAKRGGRAKFELFATGMDDLMTRRGLVERDLRTALQDQTLALAFEPSFDPNGMVVGANAEIMWDHPVHGELPGSRVRTIAEERGLGSAVSDRVVRLAGTAAAVAQVPVTVPLSQQYLRARDAADSILAAIAETGGAPSLLRLALREDDLQREDEAMGTTLNILREAGVAIVLDGFGSGAASLTGLRSYPVDQVRLDRTLLGLALDDGPSQRLLHSLIDIARTVGLAVAAADVETEAQRRTLLGMACTEMSGPLFCAPLSEAALADLLASRRSGFVERAAVPA